MEEEEKDSVEQIYVLSNNLAKMHCVPCRHLYTILPCSDEGLTLETSAK